MRRLFLVAAVAVVCVLALTGCRTQSAFSAGTPLSADELEVLRSSLSEGGEIEPTEGEISLPETSENGGDSANEEGNASSGEFDENKTDIYYTENGTVYHTNRDCSYLKKSANVICGSVAQAEQSGKAQICSACTDESEVEKSPESSGGGSEGQTADSDVLVSENKTIVYYTDGGEVYHFDKNCTYLKDSKLVNEGSMNAASAAGKNRACSRCGD